MLVLSMDAFVLDGRRSGHTSRLAPHHQQVETLVTRSGGYLDGMVASRVIGPSGAAVSRSDHATLLVRQSRRQAKTFRSGREFAAYLRLVPRQSSSIWALLADGRTSEATMGNDAQRTSDCHRATFPQSHGG
ncbi:hypothetical protein OH764_07885 [Burkholderia sp. M6-3]